MEIKEELQEPSYMSPKLLLYSQRFKKPGQLQGGFTSPSHSVATVPFQWEEAPGKPRFTTNINPQPQKSNSFRSLDLPPRMFSSKSKREFILSPKTVLDGPDVDTQSSSWIVGKSKWKIINPLRKIMSKETSRIKYSSWSWDGFRDISSRGSVSGGSGDTSFSTSTSSDGLSYSLDSKLKSKKLSRIHRFFPLDGTTSIILENMYEGINQVVPWRR
uniref:uncharacterized protein At4g00950-like n=1 Tax=Erigeron canadensis TaxID=72917 RepID=UPI001CB9C9F9|nr:uncharacterized protein At4g00950-like [Erigeron canadensis]